MNQENQTRIDEDSERSLCTVTNDHHCLKKKKKKNFLCLMRYYFIFFYCQNQTCCLSCVCCTCDSGGSKETDANEDAIVTVPLTTTRGRWQRVHHACHRHPSPSPPPPPLRPPLVSSLVFNSILHWRHWSCGRRLLQLQSFTFTWLKKQNGL